MNAFTHVFVALSSIVGAFSILLKREPRTTRRHDGFSVKLEKSPNQITAADIISLIILAFLKYIPGYSPALKAKAGSREFELPLIEAEGLLRISPQDIDRFQKSVLPDQKSTSQVTNPFFLVAQTVPLIIYFLVNRACPIKPFGAVNSRNVVFLTRPELCRDAEALRVAAQKSRLTYKASVGGPASVGFRRKRGVEFCITIEIYLDSELIVKQECWFLQFLPSTFEPKYQTVVEDSSNAPERSEVTVEAEYALHMTLADALRWAASSKDYDGIHVSPLVARAFGFNGVLAHGNHVASLAIQQLVEPHDGQPSQDTVARQALWQSRRPCTFEVKFIRPMLLPSTLAVQWRPPKVDAGNAELTVLRHGKVCMEGHCKL